MFKQMRRGVTINIFADENKHTHKYIQLYKNTFTITFKILH